MSDAANESPRSSWPWLTAPLLAAIYPVLSLYLQNIHEASISDALLCGAAVVLASIAAAYSFRALLKCKAKASVATVWLIAWFFLYSTYMQFSERKLADVWASRSAIYFLLVVWLAVFILPLLILARRNWKPQTIEKLRDVVQLLCLFVVGVCLVQGARSAFAGSSEVATSEQSVWSDAGGVIPEIWKPTPTAAARDVYLLVFDRYANEQTLKKSFGFDNGPFYAELEKRGFRVERNALTCYPMTLLSMTSTLNMRYLGDTFLNSTEYYPYLRANDVSKQLIAAGYEYYHFGNYFTPLRKSYVAHWNMPVSMLPSEFADSLIRMTPLSPAMGPAFKRNFVLSKFQRIADLAKEPKLTFAYGHFLLPHPPYVFARDGSPQSELRRGTQSVQTLYVDQLVATNNLILKTIDTILASSESPPIIMLLSDEGPYLMPGDERLPLADQIAIRTGILNAIYLPDREIAAKLPPRLMPINLFRFLFREYLGGPFPDLPDHVFYWESPKANGSAQPGTRIIDVTADALPGTSAQ